jgi:hypothetical protein
MVLQHILAVLCEVFSVTLTLFDEQIEEDPLHGLYARQISVLYIFTRGDTQNQIQYLGTLNSIES